MRKYATLVEPLTYLWACLAVGLKYITSSRFRNYYRIHKQRTARNVFTLLRYMTKREVPVEIHLVTGVLVLIGEAIASVKYGVLGFIVAPFIVLALLALLPMVLPSPSTSFE